MNKPLVSIIMNCYNSDRFLKEAIDSVYDQTYSEWEIIFWDNASTDKSSFIAKQYDDRLKYYVVKKTTEIGEARNLALSKAKGDYLAFLDCDDLWMPNKLNIQVKLLENNPDSKFCYGGVHYIDEQGGKIRDTLPIAKSGYTIKQQLASFEIGIQSVLIRNDIEISFDTKLQFSPDYDLLMLLACEYKAQVLREYVMKYRESANSLTNKKIQRWWIETKITLDRVFTRYPDLKVKYAYQYKKSYAKVNYLKACFYFDIDDKKMAVESLSHYRFLNLRFLFLYMLSVLGSNAWSLVHKIRKKMQ